MGHDVEIRDAINQGRFDGPRFQVSTLGIVWGAAPANPAAPDNPLASTVVRSVEDARAAVREQIARGADWIKLFPAGAYSFTAAGQVQYQVTVYQEELKTLNFHLKQLNKEFSVRQTLNAKTAKPGTKVDLPEVQTKTKPSEEVANAGQ